MEAVGSSADQRTIREEPMTGETAASFEESFETERVRLYGVLFGITRSREEAASISQDVFLRVWQRWERVAEMEDPAGSIKVAFFNLLETRDENILVSVPPAGITKERSGRTPRFLPGPRAEPATEESSTSTCRWRSVPLPASLAG